VTDGGNIFQTDRITGTLRNCAGIFQSYGKSPSVESGRSYNKKWIIKKKKGEQKKIDRKKKGMKNHETEAKSGIV
jgi:hypothetical protein